MIFESYFSNYIEGTEFEVGEAKQIVETGIPVANRREDSHDILGTFRLVSNRSEMMRYPQTPQELLDILYRRHAILLSGRPDYTLGGHTFDTLLAYLRTCNAFEDPDDAKLRFIVEF